MISFIVIITGLERSHLPRMEFAEYRPGIIYSGNCFDIPVFLINVPQVSIKDHHLMVSKYKVNHPAGFCSLFLQAEKMP